ncbi:ATP-binding protein [Larkinella terrae]|uniref:Novel STAND NTPase 1 domain-containing protein n=1 Tax=Larkinella terrae TaxID=2025311 RepID=A0A7K0EU43_9BACT|nr:ATP-binding protein [Larkinella terrae]MRS65337.1 hypothetical protein [Larkinella terrae]
MKSPFKFLDAYTLADKDVFFGRTKETKTLYQYIHATSLVLFYGLSGTGKTSLVQCGLSERFDGPDWYPFFIRRGHDINQSVRDALKATLFTPPASDDLPTLVNTVFRYYFRPIYLIFDQFEELFTLKSSETEADELDDTTKKEQEKFFESLHALLADGDAPCKIILIMREEFIGQLYEYERIVPALFDFRLRVEPMNFRTVREVVDKTFNKFNITCESPAITDSIASSLLKGQATSQLAYLQVYMDRLWREAYEQQYGQLESTDLHPPVRITQATLSHTGDIGSVLQRYLYDQETAIQTSLQLPDEIIMQVLDYFVTTEGTKQPVAFQQDNELLLPKIDLKSIPTETVSACLLELEKARLIRRDDRFLELAHDSLAGIIDQKRTAEQRLLNNLIQSFKVNFEIYEKKGGFLNEQQVALYDQFREKLSLDDDDPMRHYIEASREENSREAETLRTTAENLRTTAETLQTSNRNLTRSLMAVISVIVIAVGLSIWSFILYQKSEKSLTQFKEERTKLLLLDAETFSASEDFQEALDNAREALKMNEENPAIQQKVREFEENLTKLNKKKNRTGL